MCRRIYRELANGAAGRRLIDVGVDGPLGRRSLVSNMEIVRFGRPGGMGIRDARSTIEGLDPPFAARV